MTLAQSLRRIALTAARADEPAPRQESEMSDFAHGRTLIDSFDSDFPRKNHGNPDLVLHHIRSGGRFSTFDATNTLMQTLRKLEADGKIISLKSGYPWHTYRTPEQ